MSNIEIGQVWKNHLDVKLTIVAPGHQRLRVLSGDIWIAEINPSGLAAHHCIVTEKSLADAGYKLMEKDR